MDSVHVRVRHPFVLQVSPGTTICAGQHVTIAASGAEQYRWIPVTGLNDTTLPTVVASPDQTTIYEVLGSDNDHCFTDSSQITISVNAYPQVFLGKDTIVTTGSTIQLHSANTPDVDKWDWTPATGLSCTDCPNPQATVKNTITYTESVTTPGGCASSSSITIYTICNGSNWFVPNTFSPNGDGMNDVFYIRGKGLSTIKSMLIFNRWGQLVFERKDFSPNDPSAGWDGTFKGQKAPMDVYVYLIEIVCDNSMTVPYRGNVALIR
jgi:gliding motility-associated-like protein